MALAWLAERVLPLYESALNAWMEEQEEANRTIAAMLMPWPTDFKFDPKADPAESTGAPTDPTSATPVIGILAPAKYPFGKASLPQALVEVKEWAGVFHLLDNDGHVPSYVIEQLKTTLPCWADPAWKPLFAGRNWGPLEGGLYDDEPPSTEDIQTQLAKPRGRHMRMDAVDLKALGREPYRLPSEQSVEGKLHVGRQVPGGRNPENDLVKKIISITKTG